MMLNIDFDYDWLIGEGVKIITSIILNGRKHLSHSHMGRRFLAAARTKRLLRRLVIPEKLVPSQEYMKTWLKTNIIPGTLL